MLSIDKILIKMPINLIVIMMIICAYFAYHYLPKKASITYIEGVISRFEEKINHPFKGKSRSDYYIYIGDVKIKTDVNEYYWRNILEGKFAKVEVLNIYNCIYSIEVEDGSYSYRDSHAIEVLIEVCFPSVF